MLRVHITANQYYQWTRPVSDGRRQERKSRRSSTETAAVVRMYLVWRRWLVAFLSLGVNAES